MSKTLSEITRELKDFIIDLQSDAHNSSGVNKYRYNNLKVEIVDPRTTRVPQVKITVGMSEAVFNIQTSDKASGGLGPDERYVLRWFGRNQTMADLKDIWTQAEKHNGKVEE